MSFTEETKKKVMQKAGYCCCVCHKASVSVEVHHIKPQREGRDDSIENAAPLCPNCHSDYGGNPEKRTRIRQMRDWWYDKIEQMYANDIVSPEQLRQIHKTLQNVNVKQNSILTKQDKQVSDLENLRVQLKTISNNSIDNMTPVTSDVTTSAVLGTAAVSMTFGGGDITCIKCRSMVDARSNFCPHCGQYMG